MRFLSVLMLWLFAATAQAAQPRQVVAPDWSTCTTLVYPPAARANAEEGTTTLAILVGTDGAVREARVTKSSGHADLDDAARTSLASCHYSTAKVDGKPVEIWTAIAYVWTMDGLNKQSDGAK